MAHELTVELSGPVYDKLRRTAELSHQPLDAIIEQSLAQVLTPLVDDIPPEYQADVYPLLDMTLDALRAEALRRFPDEEWAEYESLLEKRKSTPLSGGEQERLAALRREADVLTFRKAYAAVLLRRRGYQVPLGVQTTEGP